MELRNNFVRITNLDHNHDYPLGCISLIYDENIWIYKKIN